VSRLRSRKSTSSPAFFSSSLTSPARRNVFEISPGQVPSLRGEPQMTSERVFVAGSAHDRCACSRRARVSIHSTERS